MFPLISHATHRVLTHPRVYCIYLCLFSLAGAFACDDGFSVAKSPDYVLRPTEEFLFPTVVVGRSTSQEIEIENVGEADLLVSRVIVQSRMSQVGEISIAYQKPSAESFEDLNFEVNAAGDDLDLNYPLKIKPSETLKLVVTYAPQDESFRGDGGAIYFETNVVDSENPERSRIDIPISVTAGAPQINVSPSNLDFEIVSAGDEKTLDITVRNLGQSVLSISDMTINGSQDFTPLINGRDPRRQPSILEDPDGDGFEGISPFDGESNTQGSFTMQVRYAPPIAGPDEAVLVITSNASGQREVNINLVANANNPCLDVSPPALEFLSSIVNRVDSRSVTVESCGAANLEITELYIEGGDGFFALEEEIELPLVLPPADEQGIRPSRNISISFTPEDPLIYNATLVIVSNDPIQPERRISILGRGTENICPQARAIEDEFYVLPLDTIELDGSPSVDQDGPNNLPVEYEWVITSRPAGSVSQILERFDNPQQPADGGRPDDLSTPQALFFVDLAGYYTAELRVRDEFGVGSIECMNPAIVTIVADPDEAIQIQLLWEAVDEQDQMRERSGDLDLHLRHPQAQEWSSSPYDCYFNNPQPDWGQLENPQDNPFLDLDDFSSTGPENLTLAFPENTSVLGGDYTVGVQYYKHIDRIDQYEYGAMRAYVRIFIEGVLAWDYTTDGDPGYKDMLTSGDIWEVASISWPAGEVTKVDQYIAYEEMP
jgi:hypothetical protein